MEDPSDVPESRDPADLLTLLETLEARALADPVLAADHAEQRRRFPAVVGDDHAPVRFREWYLLEHAPEALGAPPALCWAPAEPEPGSPWAMLLAARFGVARFEDQGTRVEEMWTGRHVDLALPVEGADEETLLVGWLAPTASAQEEIPLPGARVLAVPGLRAAFEKDLAQARVDQPRGRLSQQACERMLRGLADAATPGSGTPADAAALAAALEALLAEEPHWDAERALAMRAREGDAALLDKLAFETDADLEATRRLLLEHRADAIDEPADAARPEAGPMFLAAAPDDDAVDPDAVAAALAAFDAEADEKSVAERFAALEEALGLETGTSEEVTPLATDEAEEIGPPEVPGLTFWIAAWAWEAEQEGMAPSEAELRMLATWVEFLDASREKPVDVTELTRYDLAGFLMASPDRDALRQRIADMTRFLQWLDREQETLRGMVEALEGGLGDTLGHAIEVNAELAQAGRRADAAAALVAAEPPRVETEDGQTVPVEGLPQSAASRCREGDHVLGHWSAGHFQAAAWMPAELLPPASER